MILLISSMGDDNLFPHISLDLDNVKHYRQFKNSLFQKHEIMPKACQLKFQNPDDRNYLNLEKNLKLYKYIRKIGKELDLKTLGVTMICLSYSKFLTVVVMM